jgi:hypothetical protein
MQLFAHAERFIPNPLLSFLNLANLARQRRIERSLMPIISAFRLPFRLNGKGDQSN